MNIRDYTPMDPEIEQIHYDKKIEDSVNKLQDLEDNVRKAVKDLASKLEKANEELGQLLKMKKESERNYIQLVNRNSDIIKKQDLNRLKEENKRIELRRGVQTDVIGVLHGISNDYKELTGALKDLGKNMGKMNKIQLSWRESTAELAKLKGSQMATGGKLNKVEKSIRQGKEKVIKMHEEVNHRHVFVETALKRINDSLIKLKNSIRNFT